MPDQYDQSVLVHLSGPDVLMARDIAGARLNDKARHQSAHRPTARNLQSQYRGAAGEIAAARWLTDLGISVEDQGYVLDAGGADLTINGWPVEVMTAKVADREKTGFCVPPGKLAAARRRSAWGYLFMGTGGESEPTTLLVQAACRIEDVDLDPERPTFVNRPEYSVINHVLRPDVLLGPAEFISAMQRYV